MLGPLSFGNSHIGILLGPLLKALRLESSVSDAYTVRASKKYEYDGSNKTMVAQTSA